MNCLIHAYLTTGFLPWAKLFLRSLKFHHGEKFIVVLSTRDLSKKQRSSLKKIYKNIYIWNKPIDYNYIVSATGINKKTLLSYKREIEIKGKNVNKANKVWKQYVSVEDRYRNSILETMKKFNNFDYLLHMDIDSFFNNPIDPLLNLMEDKDLTIKFRYNKNIYKQHGKLGKKMIVGGTIGIRINDIMFDFMGKWIEHIDSIPLLKKPVGYGQKSLYMTFMDFKDKCLWAKMPVWFTANHKNYSKYASRKKALILSGNKGNKSVPLSMFNNLLEKKGG